MIKVYDGKSKRFRAGFEEGALIGYCILPIADLFSDYDGERGEKSDTLSGMKLRAQEKKMLSDFINRYRHELFAKNDPFVALAKIRYYLKMYGNRNYKFKDKILRILPTSTFAAGTKRKLNPVKKDNPDIKKKLQGMKNAPLLTNKSMLMGHLVVDLNLNLT